MDNLALHAVYLDLRETFLGGTLAGVESLLPTDFLLRFSPPARTHLVLSVHPGLAGMFPWRRPPAPRPPAPGSFALLLHRTLSGARLEALDKEWPERIVRFRFGGAGPGGRSADSLLIAEFLGRSANLILAGSDGTILGTARRLRSEFRRPEPGARYEPPPGPPGAGAEAEPGHATPQPPPQAALGAIREGRWDPVLHLAAPAGAGPAEPIDRRTAILAPVALAGNPAHRQVRFRRAGEAAEALLLLLLRHRRFAADRDALSRAVAAEVRRARRRIEGIEADRERFRDPDSLRFRGEALLAGIASAEVEGGRARVRNPYDPAGGRVDIELPAPGRSLAENAGIWFRRHRRACRGGERAERRLQAARERAAVLQGLVRSARACGTDSELQGLEARLEAVGVLRPPEERSRAVPARRRDFGRFRRVTSPDGFTVYVGRNARENDELTFRIAGDSDFWFHAAGVPGGHVLVRNPARRRDLPAPTLRFAAAAAAWY
ncbi:MAG: DUF814 domain-containing protein, partial [Acidobacteria bacterium]|nr:DUF814 domain-containing protein [Acidobacteriota bacterium]